MAIEVLLEYIETEDYGDGIINSLSHQFKEVSLIEHYQSFYRFKLNSAVSIGNLFGWFEDNVKKEKIYFFIYIDCVEREFKYFTIFDKASHH